VTARRRGSELSISAAVEGSLDEVVLERLAASIGATVGTVYGKKGKQSVMQRLRAWNNAARFGPWVVLLDLNRDGECAPPVVRRLLPNPAPGMRLRFAVRAIEAWLLADRTRLSSFLGIDPSLVPVDPDRLDNPKDELVRLARHSPEGDVRDALVPRRGSTSRVGPGYMGCMAEFVGGRRASWRPEVAARYSDSLRRCIEALRSLGSPTRSRPV
jgi:hypothetical protein